MKTTVTTACLLASLTCMSGCLDFLRPGSREVHISPKEVTPQAEYLNAATVKTVKEGDSESAVESALIWSEKYCKAMETVTALQQTNRTLTEEHRAQVGQNLELRKELDQCQKELAQANTMLLEMRSELEKWKTDVLGFRQEMRQAQEAELVVLRRVLKLLGGQDVEQTPSPQPAPAQTAASPTLSSRGEGS